MLTVSLSQACPNLLILLIKPNKSRFTFYLAVKAAYVTPLNELRSAKRR